MIAVIAAMEEEVKGLKQAMAITKSHRDRECWFHQGIYLGKNLLLVETGIGRRRASQGAELAAARFQLGAIISAGYAGALDSSLKAGDIFIYSTVCGLSGEIPRAKTSLFPALASRPELVSLASNVLVEGGIVHSQGTGISATRVAADPGAKRWLAQVFAARVVDMESYWIAQIASDKGIPFLAVRAISDTLGQDLSPMLRFVKMDGTWDKRRAILYFLARPWQVPRTMAYSGNVRRARRHLGLFLKSLLARLNDMELAR